MIARYASGMGPGRWIACLAVLPIGAAFGSWQDAATPSRGAFTVEVFGLSSRDPIDRRMAEIVAAGLVEAGHAVSASEDRDALREAEADLALFATRDPAQAMNRLRVRTADWRLECGAQGAVSDAEAVYGLSTYAARFEVSITLVRAIDGRVARSATGVGGGRSEGIEAAMDAALSEAAARAIDAVIEQLDVEAERSRTGIELLFAATRESEPSRRGLRDRIPPGHRVEEIEGGLRIEPPLEDAWFREAARDAGWSPVDRAPGVVLMRFEEGISTSSRWPIVMGLSAIAVVGAWWLLRRPLREASR